MCLESIYCELHPMDLKKKLTKKINSMTFSLESESNLYMS